MYKTKNIRFISFDTIDSTSDWAKKNTELLNPDDFTCITAQTQTAGRGRFNRTWYSPKGQNVYCTFYFTIPTPCSYLPHIAQTLSLSTAVVLKKKGFQPEIKWPNDILLCGKKVSGVLCELNTFSDHIKVFIGIGLNVNMSEEDLAKVGQPATSLAQISGQNWNLDEILTPLIFQYLSDLDTLSQGGFNAFYEKFNSLLAFKGESITCNLIPNSEAQKVQGTCTSIDQQGRLELTLPSGEVVKLVSHECQLTSQI
jgi:BirA family biotin operon repressor/biotin-[acetyl-CoA-carboxylase] ligase